MRRRILLLSSSLFLALTLLTGCLAPGNIRVESAVSNGRFVTLDYGDFGAQDPALAEEMLGLINQERAVDGLGPLALDAELTELAAQFAAEMATDDFFAHLTRDGRDPFDRMTSSYISYRYAGENLALAPSVQVAHKELMASDGHRANILGRNYGRIGIGVVKTDRGYLIVQEFTD